VEVVQDMSKVEQENNSENTSERKCEKMDLSSNCHEQDKTVEKETDTETEKKDKESKLSQLKLHAQNKIKEKFLKVLKK